jgi:hypothetical protein
MLQQMERLTTNICGLIDLIFDPYREQATHIRLFWSAETQFLGVQTAGDCCS